LEACMIPDDDTKRLIAGFTRLEKGKRAVLDVRLRADSIRA